MFCKILKCFALRSDHLSDPFPFPFELFIGKVRSKRIMYLSKKDHVAVAPNICSIVRDQSFFEFVSKQTLNLSMMPIALLSMNQLKGRQVEHL